MILTKINGTGAIKNINGQNERLKNLDNKI